jgi:hypothetical protein
MFVPTESGPPAASLESEGARVAVLRDLAADGELMR